MPRITRVNRLTASEANGMRRGKVKSLFTIVGVALVFGIVGGCSGEDHEFHVQSASTRDWLVRVAIGGRYSDDQFWVVRVRPGADGPAFKWFGSADKPIELLSEDCTVTGVFAKAADQSYSVAGVDGLSGRLFPAGTAPREDWNGRAPAIELTGECDGLILM